MNPTACLFATANENDRQRAIAAGKSVLGREVILDAPDADFTPPGSRSARIVSHAKNGRRTARQIRWYVAGKAYRSLPLSAENASLTNEWKQAGSKQ
ncbi:TPA: hypothetical protein ACP3ZG_004819 [Pseudomonas aeruginosa]|uniref:hypothetical protein n=1 Tax=Pseudomonas TaxID=286 RepID=UPI0011471B9D|nr:MULTISPECIES: hypothetical protein [Pseudomonas]ELG7182285.1 hypothetical protein [Pseudomonas aeruginosa]MBI6603236.1 hypothetical protein [Pseudomonas sp. S4_EA_1b]MBI8852336.1 hypothetical protein [Pseudomonas aeruginosa]MBW6122631.1 hypothetical protein [Pseudomonas aeruginosa]HCF9659965.1 hypothetical protein [Pseudomonas aeruginosa]